MHGDCKVSTKNLARQIGAKSVEPCKPEVANRHSGYLVGGTSPSARARCRSISRKASWRCRASPSTAGGAVSGADRPPGLCGAADAKPVQCALAE
jgi:hypothetical protein